MRETWVVSAHKPKVEGLKTNHKTENSNPCFKQGANKDCLSEVEFSTPELLINGMRNNSDNNSLSPLNNPQVIDINPILSHKSVLQKYMP